MAYYTPISLYGSRGERKYLNMQERQAFYQYTWHLPIAKRLFCQLLYYTGARISEISDLHIQQVDFFSKLITVRTLKTRRNNIYRQIPVPGHVMEPLEAWIDYRLRTSELKRNDERLWPFGSRTASRLIKHVMDAIEVDGVRACALGLRHSFAIRTVTTVPLTQVQIWMGHGSIKTTAIYLQVSGIEERQWAEKWWAEENHGLY